ncbi:unnamed protein product [Prunus armeniaca]
MEYSFDVYQNKKQLPPFWKLIEPFDAWGLDFIGIIKPKSSCRHQYILVAIDYFSKWAKAVPLKVVKAEDVANFIKTHIIHHYGVPSKIISDNALYFKCKTVVKLCDKYNIWHSFFASYNPQSNGQAEAFNKVLCNILKKIVSGTKKDWHEHLPEALWAYRTTVRTSIGCTPYSLVYGSEAILPLEIPLPSLRVATHLVNPDENVKVMLAELEALDKNASPCNINSKFTKLKWQMHGKFVSKWEGPYVVTRVFAKGAYELSNPEGTCIYPCVNGKFVKRFYA